MKVLNQNIKHFPILLIGVILLITGCIAAPQKSQEKPQTPTGEAVLPVTGPAISNTPAVLPTLPAAPQIINYGSDYKAIQLAWFYNAPSNSDLSDVARKYASFILTHKDENERDALKAAGVKSPILQYLYLAAIKNPGGCTEYPSPDQVATEVGDFCKILNQHPDWFLKSSSGGIISKNNGSVLMDPSNKDWRNFWLDRARTSMEQMRWDGVFLDNVEASVYKPYEYGSQPDPSLTNETYQAMIEDNLRFLYTGYFKPNNRPLYANIIALEDPAVWFRYLQYLDGAMLEDFAVGWGDEYRSISEWEMQMNLAEQTQALGKSIVLVSQGEKHDTDRQIFSLASYLLVNNGKAFFRYINGSSYNDNWYFDDYGHNLGIPLGPRYTDGDTWSRDFANGKVRVNPRTHAASITNK
jgi:hypothetical protein